MKMNKRWWNVSRKMKNDGRSEQMTRTKGVKSVPQNKRRGVLKMMRKMQELVKYRIVNSTSRISWLNFQRGLKYLKSL